MGEINYKTGVYSVRYNILGMSAGGRMELSEFNDRFVRFNEGEAV